MQLDDDLVRRDTTDNFLNRLNIKMEMASPRMGGNETISLVCSVMNEFG